MRERARNKEKESGHTQPSVNLFQYNNYHDRRGTPTWFSSMFWMRVGSSNSVELRLLDGRGLREETDRIKHY